MRFQLLSDWLIYLLIRVSICIMQAVRIETCHWITRRLAVVCYDILGVRRRVIDENLAHAFPQLSEHQRRELARRMWQHIMLLVCELAHLPRKIHDTNWREYITLRDVRRQVALLLQSRPVIMVSGHFGNFEVGGVIAGLLGFPTFTIARRLDNPFLDRFINRHRAVTGQFILPKMGSAREVERVLQAGGTLALLGDQHAGPKGCWIQFFGRPASCHKAVALFSLSSNAPMVITYAKRLDQPLKFEVGVAGIFDPSENDTADVKQLTQWYSSRLEETIRRTPEQYWWLHRRWKEKQVWRRKRRVRRDAAQLQPSPHVRQQPRVAAQAPIPESVVRNS